MNAQVGNYLNVDTTRTITFHSARSNRPLRVPTPPARAPGTVTPRLTVTKPDEEFFAKLIAVKRPPGPTRSPTSTTTSAPPVADLYTISGKRAGSQAGDSAEL